ncbi:unnamed protein product, partial [Nesidiocoris tenuis]
KPLTILRGTSSCLSVLLILHSLSLYSQFQIIAFPEATAETSQTREAENGGRKLMKYLLGQGGGASPWVVSSSE